jgi:hypothetical protein
MGYAQTKRRADRPWCGDDVDALSLGVTQVWVMVEAIATGHHGRHRCTQIIYSQKWFVGLVQFLRIIRRVQSHANK